MGVKTYTGPDGGAQKLSRTARAKRNADNLAMAKTSKRKKRKRENQTYVDASGNKGQRSDSDIHHTKSGTQKRTSIAYNRATQKNHRNEVKS